MPDDGQLLVARLEDDPAWQALVARVAELEARVAAAGRSLLFDEETPTTEGAQQ
jgi:hypothetical protein